jgi:hypothetical protein
MKTSIVAILLAVGLLLRPQPTPVAVNGVVPDTPVNLVAVQAEGPQVLSSAEMTSTVGAGITGCYETKAANGDTYVTCCLDVWIFAICMAVNWSAVQRLIPFV